MATMVLTFVQRGQKGLWHFVKLLTLVQGGTSGALAAINYWHLCGQLGKWQVRRPMTFEWKDLGKEAP